MLSLHDRYDTEEVGAPYFDQSITWPTSLVRDIATDDGVEATAHSDTVYLLGRRGTGLANTAILGRIPTSALLLPNDARWASLKFWVEGEKWASVSHPRVPSSQPTTVNWRDENHLVFKYDFCFLCPCSCCA